MTNETIKQPMHRQFTQTTYNQPHTIFAAIPLKIPARLDAAQTARLLGFAEHDIPALVAARLLKPLGKPMPNAMKHFAACDIESFTQNPKWLDAATQCIYDHWKRKNARKTINAGSSPITG